MSRLSPQERAQLALLPLPTLADGSGQPAAWGVARNGGLWALYTLRDGRTRTWEPTGLESADVRVTLAACRLLNERGRL